MVNFRQRTGNRDFKKVISQIGQMEEWIFPDDGEAKDIYENNAWYNFVADFRRAFIGHSIFMFAEDEEIEKYYKCLHEIVFDGCDEVFEEEEGDAV